MEQRVVESQPLPPGWALVAGALVRDDGLYLVLMPLTETLTSPPGLAMGLVSDGRPLRRIPLEALTPMLAMEEVNRRWPMEAWRSELLAQAAEP